MTFAAVRKSFQRHRRLAVWTFPVWAYESVTGVVVDWMLYRLPV
jgi:putative membrane protein